MITAPCLELKVLQKNIANILSKKVDPYLPSYVSGFRKGGTLVLNTNPHLKKEWVVNIDIENFFPSTKSDLVRLALKTLGVTELDNYNQDNLVEILTLDDALPQGSPASPVLANYIANKYIDPLVIEELNNMFGNYPYSYSRYADDLTISFDKDAETNRDQLNILIAKIINRITEETPYKINRSKVTVKHSSEKQVVTGIVVNQALSLGKKEKLKYRAIMHKVKLGQLEMTPELRGKLAYIYSINKDFYNKITEGILK